MSTYPTWNAALEAQEAEILKPGSVCPDCFTVKSKTGKCACIDKE